MNGLRVGAISFDGLPAGMEIGNLTDDIDASGLDYRAAGSWRSLTASLAGNGIDYHLNHEVYINGPDPLDPQTVSVAIITLAGLDNASITAPVSLGAVALAPGGVDQSFVITPEAGESQGMPVYVTFRVSHDHSASGASFTPLLMSSYRLYLNGVEIDAGLASSVGNGSGSQTFGAQMKNWLGLCTSREDSRT